MKDPKTRMVQAWEIMRMSDLNLCLTTPYGKTSAFLAGAVFSTENDPTFHRAFLIKSIYLTHQDEDYFYHILQ